MKFGEPQMTLRLGNSKIRVLKMARFVNLKDSLFKEQNFILMKKIKKSRVKNKI